MENKDKFVEFEKWCPECEYWECDESEDPCCDCLEDPVNQNSHKPTKYKEVKKPWKK